MGIERTNLQQVVSRRSLLGVDLEGQVEEVAEDVRQVVLIFDGRGTVRSDQIECSERRFRQIWGLTLDHLNGHNTQTPDVDLATVLLAGDYLRRHPVWCANHGVPLVM